MNICNVYELSEIVFKQKKEMQNQFIPQAVEIVKQAIDADNAGDYEKALPLYKRALEYFMTGLKYEQNPAGKVNSNQT